MQNAEKIISWIRRQVKASSAKGAVVGLSGGLDSALAAVLTKKALGRKRLLCLLLPCQGPRQDLRDSLLLVKKLRLSHKIIDIGPVYDLLRQRLPKAGRKTTGNLKARLRMSVIYYFANKFGYLVIGTSNKTELLTGYFTKYGDGAADLLPLSGLLKREVRALAEQMEIPRKIIDRPPSAGLWAGQTDEAEIGISYRELDSILGNLGRKKAAGASAKNIRKVNALIKSSRHKRQPAAAFKP